MHRNMTTPVRGEVSDCEPAISRLERGRIRMECAVAAVLALQVELQRVTFADPWVLSDLRSLSARLQRATDDLHQFTLQYTDGR